METTFIYPAALVAHIVGITLLAGSTFTEYVIFRRFTKIYDADKAQAKGLLETAAIFTPIVRISFGLLIISGVLMMLVTNGVFGEQLWFRIKFGLILAIIVNTFAAGRILKKKLGDMMQNENPQISALYRKLSYYHYSQLLFLLTIFVLSAFKFN